MSQDTSLIESTAAPPPEMGRSLHWNGGVCGSWSDPANWIDDATGLAATTPPGAADTAIVEGGSGVQITGEGCAHALILSGAVSIAGDVETGSLVAADPSAGASLSLASDTALTVLGDATVAIPITMAEGASLSVAGTLTAGTIALSGGAHISANALVLSDDAGITMDAQSSISVGADPAAAHPGFLDIQPGATVALPGAAVGAPIWNDGVLTLTPGSAIPTGQILGSGTVEVEPGFESDVRSAATFQLGPSIGAGQHIRFDGPNASLYLANTANTPDTPILVENFGVGDTLAVWGTILSTDIVADGNGIVLDLTEQVGGVHGAIAHQYIRFDTDPSTDGLVLQAEFTGTGAFGAGYTTLSLQPATPCFCPGTLIATPDGERAVESLRIGDRVTTADGGDQPILWIGRRAYDEQFVRGRPALQPIRIRAGALGAGKPRRDLFVSPRHAMLVRDVLVPAELLVNDRSILRHKPSGGISYLHIELDNHELLLAEGAPTESFVDDDSRALFQNAAEYAALYPDRESRPPRWCVPRVENGAALLSAQHFVDTIAGLMPRRSDAPLQGALDQAADGVARGWAWSPDHPDAPVLLDILAGEERVAQVLAHLYRADLAEAGIGAGCHGFEAAIPPSSGAITVRRALDGALLAA
ncbi:Hint domain-containing protein [Acetobacteraceae bacterium KSS8]|uniref:Hint domain-containing protein n=1 Tax=Endosaccharibacter trunci TaxID=2812733 RepID=A0ABT1W7V1_9PROT|nr:Hint domain-containing protein [Acetobacteraceae bacterium KSS8]